MYFADNKKSSKIEEIKSTLVSQIGEADYQFFRYEEDSEELFKFVVDGETQIEEETLSDSH